MSSSEHYVARITARDATHNEDHSQSVAACLLALGEHYRADLTVRADIDEGVSFEYIEGQLEGKPLSEAYKSFREKLFDYLQKAELDEHFQREKGLISRLQEKLPLLFPLEMDKRAYHWEILEGVLVNGKKTRCLFPLHYVSMLVWHALHDNEAFRHNYADNSLEKAQSDLINRLLTFYKTLDENIQKKTCSHGARNALVLCLNKIHSDVDLIEDIKTALNAEFCRLLSERLSDRLASNPNKALHDALLAWIKDDSGRLGDLTALLQMDETLLQPFLQRHGLLSYKELDGIVGYQDPSFLMMPTQQVLVDTLLAAYFLINIDALRNCQDKTASEKTDTLSLVINELNNPNTLVLFDEAWQKRLIALGKLSQLIDFLKKNRRDALIVMSLTESEYINHLTCAKSYFEHLALNKPLDMSEVVAFSEDLLARVAQDLSESRKTFIENFFARWAIPEGEIASRQPLYAFLFGVGNKKLITLSDDLLTSLTPLALEGEASEVVVSPYELNRIVLHGLIKTVEDFAKVLYPLNPEQKTAVYTALQGQLPGLIKTAEDFAEVLYPLNSEQRTAVYTALQEQLPGLVKATRDLPGIFYSLNPEQITATCAALREQLPGLMRDEGDLKQVLCRLNPEQITAICAALQEQLPGLIKTASDLLEVSFTLNPEQKAAFYTALQKHLSGLIKTVGDLKQVLLYLNPEQITATCTALQEQLPGLVKTAVGNMFSNNTFFKPMPPNVDYSANDLAFSKRYTPKN